MDPGKSREIYDIQILKSEQIVNTFSKFADKFYVIFFAYRFIFTWSVFIFFLFSQVLMFQRN